MQDETVAPSANKPEEIGPDTNGGGVGQVESNGSNAEDVSPPVQSCTTSSDTCTTDESFASLFSPVERPPDAAEPPPPQTEVFVTNGTSTVTSTETDTLKALKSPIVAFDLNNIEVSNTMVCDSTPEMLALTLTKNGTLSENAPDSRPPALKSSIINVRSMATNVSCQSDGEPLRPPAGSFSSMPSSTNYRDQKRERENKKCRCLYCGDILTLHAMKQHVARHTGSVPVLLCEQCGDEFGTHEKLCQHIRITHSKEQPFYCEPCNYRFSTKHNLNMHTKTKNHHLVALGKVKAPPKRLGKMGPPAKEIDARKILTKYPHLDGPEYVVLPESEQEAATLYHSQKKTSRSSNSKKAKLDDAESTDADSRPKETSHTRAAQFTVEVYRENYCSKCAVFCGSRGAFESHMRERHDYKQPTTTSNNAAVKKNKRSKLAIAVADTKSTDADLTCDTAPAQMTHWQNLNVHCMVPDTWKPQTTLQTIYQRKQELLDGESDSGTDTLLHALERHYLELQPSSSEQQKAATVNGSVSNKVVVVNRSVLNAKSCTGDCKLAEFIKIQSRYIAELQKQVHSLPLKQQRLAVTTSATETSSSSNNIDMNDGPGSIASQIESQPAPMPAAQQSCMEESTLSSPFTTAAPPQWYSAAASQNQFHFHQPDNDAAVSNYTYAGMPSFQNHMHSNNSLPVTYSNESQQSGFINLQQVTTTAAEPIFYHHETTVAVQNGGCDNLSTATVTDLTAPTQEYMLGADYLSRLLDSGWTTHRIVVEDDDEDGDNELQ